MLTPTIVLYLEDKWTMRTAAAKRMILIFWETEASTVSTRNNETCGYFVFEQHVFELEHHISKLQQSCSI